MPIAARRYSNRDTTIFSRAALLLSAADLQGFRSFWACRARPHFPGFCARFPRVMADGGVRRPFRPAGLPDRCSHHPGRGFLTWQRLGVASSSDTEEAGEALGSGSRRRRAGDRLVLLDLLRLPVEEVVHHHDVGRGAALVGAGGRCCRCERGTREA